jgi:hypothetical protein
MRSRLRIGATLVACMATWLLGRDVRAETSAPPTTGGADRFEGDLDLSLYLGPLVSKEGARGAVLARTLYLGTAGLYAGFIDALGAARPERRAVTLGVGLRPLFLPRWGSDLERGPSWLDLTIDSLTLDWGVAVSQRESGWASRPGLEGALGLEVPLLGHASGPWLGARATFRWDAAELAAPAPDRSIAAAVLVSLSWHAIVATHLVDAGDRPLR